MSGACWATMLASGLPRLCGAIICRALRSPGGLPPLFLRGSRGAERRAGPGHAPARLANTIAQAARRSSLELPRLPELAIDIEEVETAASAAIAGQERVLIAVDPDNSGAVAVTQLRADGGPLLPQLHAAEVLLYDMPCLQVAVGKRRRKFADIPSRVTRVRPPRRQADPAAVVAIVRQSLEQFAASPADMACMLEMPVPGPANGRQSVFGTGYAYGVWTGVLSAQGIPVDTVSARRWKSELGLNRCGKDGSRTLAAALFPRAEHMLRRKKDHGRAEALLILAWTLGMRLAKGSPTAALMLSLAPGSSEEPSSSEEDPAASEPEPELEPDPEPELVGLTAVGAGQTSHIIASPGLSTGRASLEGEVAVLVA